MDFWKPGEGEQFEASVQKHKVEEIEEHIGKMSEGDFRAAFQRSLEKAAEDFQNRNYFAVTRRCTICGELESEWATAIKDETWLCPECCDKLRDLMGVTEWS